MGNAVREMCFEDISGLVICVRRIVQADGEKFALQKAGVV